jgi:SAM-dependent methyltransferase
MHEAAKHYVRGVVNSLTIPAGAVLEIGGRNINGSVRPLFKGIGPYASIDLYSGPGVDLVGDVCELDPAKTARKLFGKVAVSCVVCCEVLEHATEPTRMCRWAHRILKPGGVLILTAANPKRFTHSGIDGGPLQAGEHYLGVSESALRSWLRVFRRAQITMDGADIYATAWKAQR